MVKINCPIVEELSTDFKVPYTIKDVTLITPGVWNDLIFTAEEIRKAFELTDWEDKDNISLIADHKDKPLSINDWLGYVRNQRLLDDGKLIADLEIFSKDVLVKLLAAKAKFGVSAKVATPEEWQNQLDDGHMRNFMFRNFSIVVNPACKEAYINLSQKEESGELLADVSAFERIRKTMGMSVSDFYAVPSDPPSSSKLPIYDAPHVRNAMARFNQTQFQNESEKETAKKKILAAAEKFGIKVDEFKELSHYKKLKGGKMIKEQKLEETEEKKEEEVSEEKEEVKDVEEKTEEVKEEVAEEKSEESEEAEEEVEEELSESDLVEKIITLAMKIKSKRDVPKKSAKDDNVKLLEDRIKILSEEVKELKSKPLKEKVEELSEVDFHITKPTRTEGISEAIDFVRRFIK